MQVLSEVIVAGSRYRGGVAGMMADGLQARGVRVRFVELTPRPRYGLTGRLVGRIEAAVQRSPIGRWRLFEVLSRSPARFVVVADGKVMSAAEARACSELVHSRSGAMAQYLCDDPFSEHYRTSEWSQSLTFFDVVFSTKRALLEDLRQVGVSDARFTWFGYSPDVHQSPAECGPPTDLWLCDVAFAGGSDHDRIQIFEHVRAHAPEVDMRLYSGKWSQSRALRASSRPSVYGSDYRQAMMGAVVCPCLVRRSNRDGHVMRSFELPAMGCFMLAERTDEHQELMREGVHCAMWSSPEELTEKIGWYLSNDRDRSRLARAGFDLIRAGPHTYGHRASDILEAIGATRSR